MEENNVFNSFSFERWADYVKQEKIEEEILKQRMDQVNRLRIKASRVSPPIMTSVVVYFQPIPSGED